MNDEIDSRTALANGPVDVLTDEEFESYALKRLSKNPKASARAKFNRRKLALAHAAQELRFAIDEMLEQPGKHYKRTETEALASLCDSILEEISVDDSLSQEECDRISDALGLSRFELKGDVG